MRRAGWSFSLLVLVLSIGAPAAAHARGVEAVVAEQAPVVWRAARASGVAVARLDGGGAVRAGRGRLALSLPRGELAARVVWDDGSVLAFRGFRLLAVRQDDGITLRGLVDLVDGAGAPVASDRPITAVIGEGAARLQLPATTLDGRPDPIPGVSGDLILGFEGVELAHPSRAPRALVEVTPGRQRPVGGALRIRARDGHRDRLDELRLAIRRGDGSALVVHGAALDRSRGGVVVDGPTPSWGRVALAVWGWCDVTDAEGHTVARHRPLTVWVTPDGVTRVSVQGLLHARLAGTRLK